MTLTQLRYCLAAASASSLNEAARSLYISQPSLSVSIGELEKELGFKIFRRSSRGVVPTPAGEEFLGYARQVMQQYDLLSARYITGETARTRFAVSAQHYTFAVKAFVEVVREVGYEAYEYAVNETRTAEVIDDVAGLKSEIGVLYRNDFNGRILDKLFAEKDVVFTPLFSCPICVYLRKGHPLSTREVISLEDLRPYPCLSFDQGSQNSFYFAEEVLSTYDYPRVIKATDRATMLNLMTGLDGYTLCSGIICEDFNGDGYAAVRLDTKERMTVGYITRKGAVLSPLGERYIQALSAYEQQVMGDE